MATMGIIHGEVNMPTATMDILLRTFAEPTCVMGMETNGMVIMITGMVITADTD